MPAAMSKQSLDEYIPRVRSRYHRLTGKAARSRLLDDFCGVTGYGRKHAIKVLRGQKRGGKGPGRGGAPTLYGEQVRAVLKHCWLHMEQPCGKRMTGMLPLWLSHLKEVGGRELDPENYTHVRQIIGYKRLGHQELVGPLNELMTEWSLGKNLFCTTTEQFSSTREGSKQKRKQVRAVQTPARRLLATDQLDARQREWIETRQASNNPFEMKRGRKILDDFWQVNWVG